MIDVVFHVEPTDDADAPFVWWAESEGTGPSFYAAADDLVSLRAIVHEHLGSDIVERLGD